MTTARRMMLNQGHSARFASARHEIYWRETEPVTRGTPLRHDVSCDVCVIGAGYTGLWTAYFLKAAEPTLDIHIVEADYAGAGASGHNDGFVTPTIGHNLSTLVRRFGEEEARLAYAVVGRSILEISRFCHKHSVHADYDTSGYLQVATDKAQLARLRADLDTAARMGSGTRLELLEGDRLRDTLDSPNIMAAVRGGGALVNPHRLARGLARVVREQGVQIHERTPATGFHQQPGGVRVDTPLARLTATKVVLATNAYQHISASSRRNIAPVWSYAAVTEPLSDQQLSQVTWPGREGFVEAKDIIVFGRLTAENRLLIGGGPVRYHYRGDMDVADHIYNPAATRVLRAALNRYFPCWHDVQFSHTYGGCIAMTRHLVPHVGNLGDNVFYGYGYCGNGIALTHTTGKVLRDLILGRESTYTNLLFVNQKQPSFPREPLTYLAAKGISAVLSARDRIPMPPRKGLL
ncbi:glycine/D-amino acid oxidase-like deaminating enzyme [Mycobacterium sp. MAA66]|uniref:NAD(P)/FAD-dependent oxidoreductase n=1 Tax=Mycobacterium sp. MAA66 TaxID=3156297 RepID=UPI003516977B